MKTMEKNYEALAEKWANHIDKPFSTDPHHVSMDLGLIEALFSGVYKETLECIEADPQAFAERVADYRYGLHNVSTSEM